MFLKNIDRRALIYKVLIFLAACLLFSIQPMISKFILPHFGGSPSVWTTAMLFFQLLLLMGYAFTHWLISRRLSWQKFIYPALLLLALISLFWPWSQADRAHLGAAPILQILLLLTISVGLPYFVLAGVSPLLQVWFNREPSRPNPYGLYVWSNVGSLLGLLVYPSLAEPLWSIGVQKDIWQILFVLLLIGLFYLLSRYTRSKINLATTQSEEIQPIRRGSRLAWLLWPALASFLLLAITNYITQDLAAVPLLWVLPLSLYLLSFILTFAGEKFYYRRFWSAIFLLSVLSAVLVIGQRDNASIVQMLMSMTLALLSCCVVCHGELYLVRPDSGKLTQFYLWVSAGGALGGLLVSVVAPLVFDFYAELYLGLALILLVTFVMWRWQKVWVWPRFPLGSKLFLDLILVVSLAVMFLNIRDLTYGQMFFYRDFFGVLNVSDNDEYKSLNHGSTLHGLQFKEANKICWPTSYYSHDSGLGLAAAARSERSDLKLGVVGLGVGTTAVYGSELRFYELNPQVETIARQEFSYLSACAKDKNVAIVLGDARLSLAQEANQNFDILAVDAFTGDAIPVHLLTSEAVEIYRRHLKDDGILAIHISNRYVDLGPVIGGLAESFDLQAALVKAKGDSSQGSSSSLWALLSKDKDFFKGLLATGAIKAENMDFPRRVFWTDQYSNIFTLLKWK